MYYYLETLKTPNCYFGFAIVLYSIIMIVLSNWLQKKNKYFVVRILCVLPVIASVVHYLFYGYWGLQFFILLYVESLIILLYQFSIKKKAIAIIRQVFVTVGCLAVFFIFTLNNMNMPKVHNYTRYSYTESFEKTLATMEKEYVLSDWKQIDYAALREKYMPIVEEAEKNNDEVLFAATMTEVAYRFYDGHVSAISFPSISLDARNYLSGNNYGLSMTRTKDDEIIAICVEEGSEVEKLGIHNGTVITAWDDVEIEDALSKTECINAWISFPVKENEDAYRPFFLAGHGGDKVKISYIDDDGREQTVEVNKTGYYWKKLMTIMRSYLHDWDEVDNFCTRMIDDECGYLALMEEEYDSLGDIIASGKGGYYPELTEFYADKIEKLIDQGMKYLVIDLRNNSGGYDCVGGALASLFQDEKTPTFGFGYQDATGYHIKESSYVFPDGRYKDIPVVVLVNDNCMSAGDGAARFLSECDNVTLMGLTASNGINQNNGGIIHVSENIEIIYPVYLSLSADSEPLIDTDYTRQNNIPLDVVIPMTRESALKIFEDREDYELEYAINYLKR